jgi:hypothetical protein
MLASAWRAELDLPPGATAVHREYLKFLRAEEDSELPGFAAGACRVRARPAVWRGRTLSTIECIDRRSQ